MVRGRKALPGKIHRLHGTHREDRHGGELEVESVLPDPPERLKGEALEEWNRMAPDLHKVGVLTVLDVVALEMYCNAFSQYLEAGKLVEEDGLISRTPNGYKQSSAASVEFSRAEKRVLSFLAEFGMTPATRARIKLIKQKPKQLDLLTLLDELSEVKSEKVRNG